jgi:hypothetical protein
MATSYAPLITRVYEVLVDGEGVARTLASGDRFAAAIHPNRPRGIQSVDAHVRRQCWIAIDGGDVSDVQELGSRRIYDNVPIRVELAYFLEHHAEHASKWRTTHAAILDSIRLVHDALGYPGNLEETEAGASTGLGGYGLQPRGFRLDDPDTENNIWTGRALFVATIAFDRP